MKFDSPEYLTWLQGLKVGDVVCFPMSHSWTCTHEKSEIVSLTPKRIRVKVRNSVREINRETGQPIGDKWRRAMPWTDEHEAEVRRKEMAHEAWKLMKDLNTSGLSTAALGALIPALKAAHDAMPKDGKS
jgi:hypothetical protein